MHPAEGGDGDDDILDALRKLKMAVGLVNPDEREQVAGDVHPDNETGPDGDGDVDVQDALRDLKSAVGLFGITSCGGPPAGSLSISKFTPKSAHIATLVNISGTGLSPDPGSGPLVTINKQGGGTIEAPVANYGADRIQFVIPPGADVGPLTVTVDGETVTTTSPLVITPTSDFTVTVGPSAADLIQGESVSYVIDLQSTNDFGQLAALDVLGIPPGVTTSFTPPQITTAQTSVLTVGAPSDQPTTSVTLTVRATAAVDGIDLAQSADVVLNIVPVSTSFLSRTVVDDALQTNLAGVTVTLLGKDGAGNDTGCSGQTISDAAGNFSFTNLPVECTGGQLIRYDGSTATSPPGDYAGVDLFYDIVLNEVTVSTVLIHLPRIDDSETVMVNQNSSVDQNFTFNTIPNLSVTVYAGTVLTLLEGGQPDPFPLTAIQVPVDRLPDAMPPNPAFVDPFIVAFQPANATASQPVAVYFPNVVHTPPGTIVTLMTLDPTKGVMVGYGTGVVSENGSQIVPDFDPDTPGRRFGLVHFDWHGPVAPTPQSGGCGCSGGGSAGPGGTGGWPIGGKPVTVIFGEEQFAVRDIGIDGPRGSIEIIRSYRHLNSLNGPFGIGTSHNYGHLLDAGTTRGGVINLVLPDTSRDPFSLQADGTYRNFSRPSLRGVVLRATSVSRMEIRWKEGTLWEFFAIGQSLSYLNSITDANGNRITLVRNPAKPLQQITEVIDPVGRKLRLKYDETDRVTSIVDPIGRIVRYSYNQQGMLEAITDPEGGVANYLYDDGQNRLTHVIDARGITIAQNVYSGDRVVEQIHADGGKTKIEFDPGTPLVLFATATPLLSVSTDLDPAPIGQPRLPPRPPTWTVEDPLGRITNYRFDPAGYLLTALDPLAQITQFTRASGTNLLLSERGYATCDVCGDPSVGDISYSYDSRGNVITQTDALGNTITFTYEPIFNKIASVTDALNNTSEFTYNSQGSLLTQTDENGHITAFEYNEEGQIEKIIDPLDAAAIFGYDSFGNLSQVTDAFGNSMFFRYDELSRLVEVTDPLGIKSGFTYDRLDRIVEELDGHGNSTSFTYDRIGNLLSITDARGQTTSSTFDEMSRLIVRTDPIGETETFSYDLVGNLIEHTDRRGLSTSYEYDPLNRVVSELYADGGTVRRSYDARGRLIRADDSASGVYLSGRDELGRIESDSGPFGTVRFSYDALGQVTSREVLGQAPVTYAYDPTGNLVDAVMGRTAANFTYDAGDFMAQIIRPNGVTSEFTYNAVGHLITLIHASNELTIDSQSYDYDAAGNWTGRESDVTALLATRPGIRSYDDANRLLSDGTDTYTYDANGNLKSRVGPEGTTTYIWNARDQLQSIDSSNGVNTTFLFDFAGNLIEKRNTTSGEENVTERYILDDLTNIALIQRSSGEDLAVLSGRTIDQHIAVLGSDGADYVLTDAINSTVVTIDDTGKVSSRFAYEPYGETTVIGDSAFPFQFTGRLQVGDGLYYYRARFYDPEDGRFISEDPFGSRSGQVNFYSYVGNNPIRYSDPQGLLAIATTVYTGVKWSVKAYKVAKKICRYICSIRNNKCNANCSQNCFDQACVSRCSKQLSACNRACDGLFYTGPVGPPPKYQSGGGGGGRSWGSGP